VLKLLIKRLLLHSRASIDNADHFAQWLLESYDFNGETGRAGSRFYSTPGVGLNQVRIAYVLKKEDLIKAVQILKQLQLTTLSNKRFSYM
jgi:aspartate aminotransferase